MAVTNKTLLEQMQEADPASIWFTRWGALRMAAALVWLAVWSPYVRVRKQRRDKAVRDD
jgi:hypothetical protein